MLDVIFFYFFFIEYGKEERVLNGGALQIWPEDTTSKVLASLQFCDGWLMQYKPI
jgi:hypothetical protein